MKLGSAMMPAMRHFTILQTARQEDLINAEGEARLCDETGHAAPHKAWLAAAQVQSQLGGATVVENLTNRCNCGSKSYEPLQLC